MDTSLIEASVDGRPKETARPNMAGRFSFWDGCELTDHSRQGIMIAMMNIRKVEDSENIHELAKQPNVRQFLLNVANQTAVIAYYDEKYGYFEADNGHQSYNLNEPYEIYVITFTE